MITRAYGRAFSDHEIEDVYSSAWAAILSALRTRGAEMSDEELRAYILTAVASHASKEMRRRSRKPTGPIGTEAEQVLTDGHLPLPDEIVVGSEARGVARDLLTSIPQRRRAVMLLRYGWGLSPTEVCALVPGLSPRAYRKEVTKGIEQLIERLRLVESGEWCQTREQMIRDLVAGTADESSRLQAVEHLEHCRACAGLAARLSGHLHELGGAFTIASVAGVIGTGKIPIVDWALNTASSGREAIVDLVARAHSMVGSAAAAVDRGAGSAAAGVAKLVGVSGAGKAALGCVGAGLAAGACVAAGVVPGVAIKERENHTSDQGNRSQVPEERSLPAGATVAVLGEAVGAGNGSEADPATGESPGPHENPPAPPPAPAPQPEIPRPIEEFDPVAAGAPTSFANPTPPPTAISSPSAGPAAQDEFGP